MYARMDSVEIPQDHTNVTAIQEMSLISVTVNLNSQNNLNSEIFHRIFPTQFKQIKKLIQGFKFNRQTSRCENINECLNNPCNGGECIDTEGSFECQCGKFRKLDITGRVFTI